MLEGYDSAPLGNVKGIFDYQKKKKAIENTDHTPLKPPMLWIMDQGKPETLDSKGENYDAGKAPNMLVNLAGNLNLFIGDPAIVQEMLVTKNAQIDKTGEFEGVFKNLFGNSFIFSKSDEHWKIKRKATAHAFYKDRLTHMLDELKKVVLETQTRWITEIDASPTGSTQIELTHDVLLIL